MSGTGAGGPPPEPNVTPKGGPKATASEVIPPVAMPFVSDRAKKMIDLVSRSQTSSDVATILPTSQTEQPHSHTKTDTVSCRSRNGLRKNVSQPTTSMAPSSTTRPRAGRATHPSSTPLKIAPNSSASGTCSCPRITSPTMAVLASRTWSMV